MSSLTHTEGYGALVIILGNPYNSQIIRIWITIESFREQMVTSNLKHEKAINIKVLLKTVKLPSCCFGFPSRLSFPKWTGTRPSLLGHVNL